MADPQPNDRNGEAKKKEEAKRKEWEEKIKRLRLNLELSDPERVGENDWRFTATATAQEAQGLVLHPSVDVPVQFALNEQEVDSPRSTEGNGRAKYEFEGMKLGKYSVRATVPGTSRTTQKTTWVKEDRKLTLEFGKMERKGNTFKLYVRVRLTDRNGPVSGAAILFTCDNTTRSTLRYTDSSGGTWYEFTGLQIGEHTFDVEIPGTTVRERQALEVKDDREIVFEPAEVNEAEGELEFTLPVVVREWGKPAPDTEVQYYLDGAPQGAPQTIESDGRTLFTFKDLKRRVYTFSAQIVGTDKQRSFKREIKEAKPKRAVKLVRLGVSSFETSRRVTWAALTEEDRPTTKAKVQVIDHGENLTYTLETDERGSVEYAFSFGPAEYERTLNAYVLGSATARDSVTIFRTKTP